MTSTGKIARLPHAIREQLNRRLSDAEPAEPLLAWLNALPEVWQILVRQFDGRPVSPQNLSEWRTGAFAEWSLRQEILGALQSAGETATLVAAASHQLAEQLLTILTARYARFLNQWDGEVTPAINQQLKALSRLTRDLVTLRKAAQVSAQPVRHASGEDQSPGTGESDQIKPNQACSGVGTARPHIIAPDQQPGSSEFQPCPIQSKELLDDPEVRRRLLVKYGVPAAPTELVLHALDFGTAAIPPIALNPTKSTQDSASVREFPGMELCALNP